MKMKTQICLLLLLLPLWAHSQDFPRDTSYTLHSTWLKLKKDHPEVEKVYPRLPENVKAIEEVVYRQLGKRQLKMNIYRPKGRGKHPAVLLIHGGGWKSGDKSLQVPMAQRLAGAGYVTAVVEYRLSPEAQYPAAVHDLKAAIRWLKANARKYHLNPDKFAVYGASAGAQLASLVGTTAGNPKLEGSGAYPAVSSEVQAIVNVDGILAFKHPDSREGQVASEWLGGTYRQAAANWEEASALSHAGEHTPPMLFIASSYPRFHAGKQDLMQILDAHGIYHESCEFPGSPHAFWLLQPWFDTTFQYTLAFLGKVLGN